MIKITQNFITGTKRIKNILNNGVIVIKDYYDYYNPTSSVGAGRFRRVPHTFPL